MNAQLRSAGTAGIEAYLIDVETHVESKLFSFNIVGLPDSAVRESRERIMAAIANSGLEMPQRRLTINLAPADVRKEGTSFDLPIALGILIATGQLESSSLDDTVVVGELALDGSLRPVRGILPIAHHLAQRGIGRMIVPNANAGEAALVDELEAIPVDSLKNCVLHLRGELPRQPYHVDHEALLEEGSENSPDMSDVRGQENVKRAMEVAAAGGHNLIMVGPPGAGKTMIAKRIPSILPPMSFDEALETTKIHSVANVLPSDRSLVSRRPFRSPHHTISNAALVGGGIGVARPGEISLAHHGVLFLDELPEFARNVLDVMRQPLEENRITISRSRMALTFPSNFMLVASMNPCPCGHYGDAHSRCRCTPTQIQRYISRISGPLLDRIDIHIEVAPVQYRDLASRRRGERSDSVRERVVGARNRQTARFAAYADVFKNADMEASDIRRFCRLDDSCEELLRMAMRQFALSARAYTKILKVARTIADLDGDESIRAEHLSEAIQYRSLDRQFWHTPELA
jgi:magnesium chelatase family protein